MTMEYGWVVGRRRERGQFQWPIGGEPSIAVVNSESDGVCCISVQLDVFGRSYVVVIKR